MYGVMALAPTINGCVNPAVFYFVWEAGLWAAAGAAFGLAMWYFSEKQFVKQNSKQES